MRTVCSCVFFLLVSTTLTAQTLNIDKLERTALASARMETGFSAVVEGIISDPNLDVFVFVHQPRLNAWRLFPAVTEFKPESPGRYRWRAICQFGELNGKGIGDTHQVRAMAFDKKTVMDGIPEKAVGNAIKTEVITIKRVK